MVSILRTEPFWNMSHHFPIRNLTFALLACLVLTASASGSGKQRVIVLAIDQSGSMSKSDPESLRVEAGRMLLELAGPNDRIGLIAFGDEARWLQEPIERKSFDVSKLSSLGDSDKLDKHTAFAPVLQRWSDLLANQDSSFWESHEASLLLFTDGRSDPPDHHPDKDQAEALGLARNAAARGKIFVIGLGHDLDGEFLDSLANLTDGTRWDAQNSSDLPDAFLRVATRILSLPVYRRLSGSGRVDWNGNPEQASLVFIGSDAKSFQAPGEPRFLGQHIAVRNLPTAAGDAALTWSGAGNAFLCLRQPLRLESIPTFPASLLTEGSGQVSLRLVGAGQDVRDAYFLKQATIDLLLQGRNVREVLPGTSDGVEFHVKLGVQQGGDFAVTARLHAPYGSVETYLLETRVSSVPVALPPQVDLRVFDPIPRRFFPTELKLKSILPTGAVQLTFAPSEGIQVSPSRLTVSPSQNGAISITANSGTESIQTLEYLATWSDGTTTAPRRGLLTLRVRGMSTAEFLVAKWPWIAVLALIFCGAVYIVFLFWPRPLKGALVVFQSGKQVFRLELPREGRFRRLVIRESATGTALDGDCVTIQGGQERGLAEIQSVRRGIRWVVYGKAHEARLYDARGLAKPGTELGALRNPVFKTQDDSIQIRFM
jgi:von Willebrand factor type A domain